MSCTCVCICVCASVCVCVLRHCLPLHIKTLFRNVMSSVPCFVGDKHTLRQVCVHVYMCVCTCDCMCCTCVCIGVRASFFVCVCA